MAPQIRDVGGGTLFGSGGEFVAPEHAAGDLLLLIHSADNGSLAQMGVTGGWTPLGSRPGPTGRWGGTKVWKKAASAGAESYVVTQAASADGVIVIVAISGASTAGIVVEQTGGFSSSQVQTPVATPPVGGCLELRWAAGVPPQPGANVEWDVPAGYALRATAQSRLFYAAGTLVSRALTGTAPVGVVGITSSSVLDTWDGFTILVPPTDGGDTPSPEAPPPTIPALPSGEQVVHYTYVFADLLTDEQICKDLDLYDVSYDRRITEGGAFSAGLVITDDATAAKVARILPRYPGDLSTGPGRTIVHVYRNGVVWGSYVIWRGTVSRSGRGEPIRVQIEGSSLESYLKQVKIRDDLGPYAGVDQIVIARTLLTAMQSTAPYNLHLTLQAGTSGVTQDRQYLASQATTYGEQLAELANTSPGFEWIVQVIDNGDGTRTRYWLWGAPKFGASSSDHKFMEPGNVLSWSEDIDALRGGTAFQARGESTNSDASSSSEPLVSDVALAQAHIDAGWPGIDVTTDYSGVDDEATLNAYATWAATTRGGAVRVHQATVRLPANTQFGPGGLGDWVTLMLVNPWWPIVDGVASFAKRWRVVGMAFKPPSKGSGQEECTLTFEEAEEGP